MSPRGSVCGHAGPGLRSSVQAPSPGRHGGRSLFSSLRLRSGSWLHFPLWLGCFWLEMLLPLRKPGAACLWIALWVPRGQECRPLTPHSVNHCCVCDHRSGRTGPLELEATDRRSCPALCLRALPLGHWPGRARSWGHSPGGWAVGGGGPARCLPWGVGGRHPTPPPPHARASVTGPFPFIASHRQFPLVLPWACEPGCPPGPSPASCGTRVSASRGSPAPEGERACLPVRGCQAAS